MISCLCTRGPRRVEGAFQARARELAGVTLLAVRRLAGVALLAILVAAALIPPEAVWLTSSARLAAVAVAAGTWLPVALAVGAVGMLVGAALGRGGVFPAWGTELSRRRWARWLVAAVAGLAVGTVAALAFGASPMHVDAVVQAFQANVLRGGSVVAPAPPLPEFFVTLNTAIKDGRWVGQFPPGFPALMALAGPGPGRVLLHAVVGASLAYAVYRSGEAVYGPGEGLLASALVAASPFALLLSASGLNHAAAAAMGAFAFWLAVGGRGSGGPGGISYATACGLALGGLVATRPLDGLVVAACVAPLAVKHAGRRLRACLGLLVGMAPPLVLMALYDRAATGSAFELGYTFVWGPAHGLGFHPSPWGEPHTLARGLLHLHRDLWLLNAQAFGRALPLLAVAALPLILGGAGGDHGVDSSPAPDSSPGSPPWAVARPRPNREYDAQRTGEAVLYALFLGLPAVYVLYWHHDWFLGPRYLFTAFPFFALLVARGILIAARRLDGRPIVRRAWIAALAAGALWLLAMDLPERVGAAFALRPEFRLDVAREARAQGIEEGVVFVKESWGSRLLARLLARGLRPAEAERVYRRADHCALERLLADRAAGRPRILAGVSADLRSSSAPVADATRNGDPTLRLSPGVPLAAVCAEEIAYDLAAPYGVFTPQMALQDPWLRSPLVIARDLRNENARLLSALGRSRGYLYVPGRLGAPAAFLPLEPGEVSAF